MSDFWGGLTSGSFKWPNAAINTQGPLPNGNGIHGIDGIINGSDSLLGNIHPYYGPKAGPAHSDRNYQQIPHRKQYFVPELFLPNNTGQSKIRMSHSIDQGDVVWILHLDRPIEVFYEGHPTMGTTRKFDNLPVLVNIATVNYLLAGVQKHLAELQVNEAGVKIHPTSESYWAHFTKNWMGHDAYNALLETRWGSVRRASIKNKMIRWCDACRIAIQNIQTYQRDPAQMGAIHEVMDMFGLPDISKPVKDFMDKDVQEDEKYKNGIHDAAVQEVVEWIFANRVVPWGVAAGSEKQGGQHEMTLAPVTGAASHMSTLTLDGRNFDIINIWSNVQVHAGDLLTFHLQRVALPKRAKVYGLNHYYKSMTVEASPFTLQDKQRMDCLYSDDLSKVLSPDNHVQIWQVEPSTRRTMHTEHKGDAWVDYSLLHNVLFRAVSGYRPPTTTTANRLYWKVAQTFVQKPQNIPHDSSDDRVFLRSQLLEVNYAPILVNDTECGYLAVGGNCLQKNGTDDGFIDSAMCSTTMDPSEKLELNYDFFKGSEPFFPRKVNIPFLNLASISCIVSEDQVTWAKYLFIYVIMRRTVSMIISYWDIYGEAIPVSSLLEHIKSNFKTMTYALYGKQIYEHLLRVYKHFLQHVLTIIFLFFNTYNALREKFPGTSTVQIMQTIKLQPDDDFVDDDILQLYQYQQNKTHQKEIDMCTYLLRKITMQHLMAYACSFTNGIPRHIVDSLQKTYQRNDSDRNISFARWARACIKRRLVWTPEDEALYPRQPHPVRMEKRLSTGVAACFNVPANANVKAKTADAKTVHAKTVHAKTVDAEDVDGSLDSIFASVERTIDGATGAMHGGGLVAEALRGEAEALRGEAATRQAGKGSKASRGARAKSASAGDAAGEAASAGDALAAGEAASAGETAVGGFEADAMFAALHKAESKKTSVKRKPDEGSA